MLTASNGDQDCLNQFAWYGFDKGGAVGAKGYG